MIHLPVRLLSLSRKQMYVLSVVAIVLIGIILVSVLALKSTYRQPTITVSGAKLQEEIDHKNTFYKSQHNTVNQDTLRSDTLQQLARDSLVYSYAKQHNITVSQNDINTAYQQRISTTSSEQSLLDKLSVQYGINKQQYLSGIELDILKDKIQSHLGKPLNEWLNSELPKYHIVVSYK